MFKYIYSHYEQLYKNKQSISLFEPLSSKSMSENKLYSSLILT